MLQGGVSQKYRPLGVIRWSGPHGSQRIELHRTRLRHSRGARLLRSRTYGDFATQARRDRLGADFRERWRALVSYRRNLLRALRDHAAGRAGSHGSGQTRGHHHLLRPELPGVSLEIDRRQSQGAGGEPASGSARRRDDWQRRRFHRRPGIFEFPASTSIIPNSSQPVSSR